MSEDVTLAELGRSLAEMRGDLRDLSREFTRVDVYRAAHQALVDRVASLERDRDWLRRAMLALIGTMIASVGGSLVVFLVTSR